MKTLILHHLLGFFCAAAAGLYVIPLLISIAHKFGITDAPDGKLKQHKVATPYLGGLGVYVSFITALALVYPLQSRILWLVLGTTLLMFLGLIDDLVDVPPGQKFIGHIVAVSCFMKGGIWLRSSFFSYWFAIPLSFVWMLTVINAFNLVDVMDGLSSVLALGSAVGFLCVALLAGQYEISLLMAIFGGAMAAFFYFNKRPARIYLGDCGSLFVGGFFAAAPLLVSWGTLHPFGFLVPPALLAVPLAEVVTLIVVRAHKRIPFYQGSPHHFAHYLLKKGWDTHQILFFVMTVCVASTLLCLLFLQHYIPVLYWPAIGSIGFASWLFIVMR